MKKSLNTIVSAALGVVIGSSLTVFAGTWVDAYKNTEVSLSINGQTHILTDATTGEREYPLTYLNRTYIPLRSVATLLGYNVDYDAGHKTVIVNSPDYVAPTPTPTPQPEEENNESTGPIKLSDIEYLKGLVASDVKASTVIGPVKGDEAVLEYYIEGILESAYTEFAVSSCVHSQSPFKKDFEEFVSLIRSSNVGGAKIDNVSIEKYLYDANNKFRGVLATYNIKIGSVSETFTSLFLNETLNESSGNNGLKLFCDIVG